MPEPRRIEDIIAVSGDKLPEIAIQECKREQLNLLFSRLNIESQTMQTQKDAVETKI
jgi:hypothetical protein